MGDPVAVVLGEDRYAVVDAAEEVVVEYDPLPVVTDPEKALEGAPFVHEELGTNKVHEWSLPGGDVEAGFAEADVIVERRVVNHRTAGAPIEPRGVLADYRAGELTLWTATQVPHFVRLFLSILLGISEEKVRVIAPEVGGGFGSKLQVYGEEVLACWCSRKLERPVKWIETRTENMATAHQGRDQIATVRMGAKRDGTITALARQDPRRLRRLQHAADAADPVARGVRDGRLLRDPERPDRHRRRVHEQVPDGRDPRRGPARGDAHGRGHARPARGRAGNCLRSRSGARTSSRTTLPGGGRDRRRVRLGRLRQDARQAARARRRGRVPLTSRRRSASEGVYRGIGFSTYTEICGLAPSRITGPGGVGVQAGGWESALVRVHNTGAVTAYTGHLRPRPGPRDGVRADRRRPARRRPRDRRGDPRRHGHRPGGPQHVRLAVARGRRRGARAVREPDRRQGQGGRRPQPRGGARGHRARRRQVLGARLARQGHDARRGRRRRVPEHGARGDGPRARGDDVPRPGELRVPVRSARVRRRRRPGDGQDEASCGTSRSTTAATRSTR